MTKITKDDVLRVAQLAHLELADGEVDNLTRQLDGILSYVEKLNELNTDGVEPMSQVVPARGADVESAIEAEAARVNLAGTPLREDVHVQSTVIDEVLAGAPDPEPPYFRVPKVIDK
jgi:aspartyl-tRNA(Asn)/glutamyl-tRNA(Gln) amidotransferase subunit C